VVVHVNLDDGRSVPFDDDLRSRLARLAPPAKDAA
jgi:acyl-CoA thioesterase FadM